MTTLTLGLKAVMAINQQTLPDQTITTRNHFRRKLLDQNEGKCEITDLYSKTNGNKKQYFSQKMFVFIWITRCFGYKTLNIYIAYMMLKHNSFLWLIVNG